MKKGTQKRIDTPGQQKWYHLFGAYNFLTDEVVAMSAPRKNSDAFVAFLDTLVQQLPDDRPIVLVLDNASYHHSAIAVAGFAVFEEHLMPLFLPAYCSNLNPIERYWLHLKGSACANVLFPSIQALVESVFVNLDHQNDQANSNRFSICKDLKFPT
jgi:transposase